MLQDKLDDIIKKHKPPAMQKVADGKTITDHLHEFWNSENKFWNC